MNTERSDFGKTKVLSPTEGYVKIEQIIYFKYKNMLHNISKLSSGAVRSIFNILDDFHELEGLHPCGLTMINTYLYNLLMKSSGRAKKAVLHASQSSSRFFGFVFHASSFILPQTCSWIFEPTHSPPEQLSCGVCRTWAC